MEILLIIVPFFASILTFFCGFGLGTLLLPVFMIFFPPGMAIALTALVHLLNSIFKFVLLRKQANYNIVWIFGLTSVIGALVGSLLSVYVDQSGIMYEYHLFSKHLSVSWIAFLIGLLLVIFSILEISKVKFNISPDKNTMMLGGGLSGFFGGLSGHQGALRTAFLNQMINDKSKLVASNSVLAMLVDFTRIPIYWNTWILQYNEIPYAWLIVSVLSAWCGAFLGNRYLKKVSWKLLDNFIALAICIFGLALMFGVI
jgi:uncharacterized protein